MFRSSCFLAALVALSALVSACNDSPTSASGSATFTKTDLKIGPGAEAVSGNVLTVNYTGWFFDASKSDHKGVQFETSIGSTPFSFTLGVGEVIAGWDQGVPGMRVGGVRRLEIPAPLAYGAFRNGSIPPNASLVFEIELVSIP
jgi:FKBP-type peptidyl-prolyl cis-trans isomerase FkpA